MVLHSMQKMTVTEADEWAIFNHAAKAIFNWDESKPQTPRYNNAFNNYERVIELAQSLAAELCVARYFGLDYDVNQNKGKVKADVGQGLEVRWTSYIGGNLIVYPNDRETDIAVLVVGKSPVYHIAGWLPVSFARRKRFKNPRQDSWWVDQANLNPIETLVRSEYATAAI